MQTQKLFKIIIILVFEIILLFSATQVESKKYDRTIANFCRSLTKTQLQTIDIVIQNYEIPVGKKSKCAAFFNYFRYRRTFMFSGSGSEGPIRDISPICAIKHLTRVDITNNQFEDIRCLKKLKYLADLDVSSCKTRIDLRSLSPLRSLRKLSINSCKLKNIAGIEGIKYLKELSLEDNEIRNIAPLARLTRLKKLSLLLNPVNDWSPLKGLTNLRDLKMGSAYEHPAPVSNSGSKKNFRCMLLKNLKNLVQLDISYNELENIKGLENLVNLKYLNLMKNNIRDISPLKKLKRLTELNISSNAIKKISSLKNLARLKKLDLSMNKIVDVSVLSSLTGLRELDLAYNQISNITPLCNLLNLNRLAVHGNNHRDTSCFANLKKLNFFDGNGKNLLHCAPKDQDEIHKGKRCTKTGRQ
ncbi:MAG: leucine-rich repeat domain-containing protein [bacterium]|nr:leucine-rich repeat domain-containing protein [bacterium]